MMKYGYDNYFNGSKRKFFIDSGLTLICWTENLKSQSIIIRPTKESIKI